MNLPVSLVDEKTAARILGVSVRFLQQRRYQGGGPPFIKVGSAVRYRHSDLDDWVRDRTFTSTSAYETPTRS